MLLVCSSALLAYVIPTVKCLSDPGVLSSIFAEAKLIKEELMKEDWHLVLKNVSNHSSLKPPILDVFQTWLAYSRCGQTSIKYMS